ncbi:hypothetical protein BDF22DRAFT_757266 [Syncephalis plumigaleata]|nr:hypothetical protein BDF22DRAFT_757266 [Syncephalis plumigaleata]
MPSCILTVRLSLIVPLSSCHGIVVSCASWKLTCNKSTRTSRSLLGVVCRSQAPEKSIVFTKEYFGGNGRGKKDCVTDGPFADWKPHYVANRCLSRKFIFGSKAGTFYAPEAIQYSINHASDFFKFSRDIESTSHATVHNGIGGGMWYMYSPSDPLFYCTTP